MQSTLRNNFIEVIINDKGAELCSIKNTSGIEFIWQAHPEFWARYSPLLFPIVGKLKNNSYQFEGKIYNLSQHGFARDSVFQLSSLTSDQLIFSLENNTDTKKSFPFNFLLTTSYFLSGNKLNISYEVKNKDNKKMPFSIGAHPAFNFPFEDAKKFEDGYLEFEKDENLNSLEMSNGFFTGENFPVLKNQKILQLNYDVFAKADTLVFENIKSNWLKLCSLKSNHQIKISVKGFPFLGIWTKPNAPFICLEPWYGLADFENYDGNIFNKKGIQILEPGEKFNCSYSITID